MNSHGTNLEAELHVRPRLLSWKVSFRRIANYYLSLRFEWIRETEKDQRDGEYLMKISIGESLRLIRKV